MKTVKDILGNRDYTLVRAQLAVQKVFELIKREYTQNRSLFVKYNTAGRIVEVYEFTGYVPVESRELRKIF